MKGFMTMIQSWRLLTRLVYEQGSDGFLPTPPLMSNCSNLPFATQRRSWRPESCLQEMGEQNGLCAGNPSGARSLINRFKPKTNKTNRQQQKKKQVRLGPLPFHHVRTEYLDIGEKNVSEQTKS